MTEPVYIKGCCPLDCQDTCSWVAKVEDGRVTSVRGAKEHPITRGVLCAKVNDYEARTYAADRLLYPLRRTGPKGSGRFERISWDEAIGVIADRFGEVHHEYGGEALLPHRYLGSMGIVQRRALMRIFHALNSSKFHGSICGASGNALEAEGFPRGFEPELISENKLIVLWGCNILTTCHHQWQFINEAKKRNGARIVAIDPIRTRTAAACDQHIALLPGTDAVLAAAMAHVILRDGMADLEFAREVASDFDDFVTEVEAWAPARAEAVCGVSSETIEALAREFALVRPALLRVGVGPQQSVHGETFFRTVSALSILCGKWRDPGGGLFSETNPVLDEGRAESPHLRTGSQRSLDIARLGETLTDPDLSPPIRAMMVWNVNPAVVQPDVARVLSGLAREDLFTVVLEHFMTDTARFADIVLPSTTQLEHFDIVGAWGHHFVSANNPAIPPVGEAKSHGEVMRLLAAALGLEGPEFEESDEEIAASTLPPGMDIGELKAKGWIKSPPPAPSFDAKVKISANIVAPDRPDGLFQLLTPKSHYFLNSSFVNQYRQRRAQGAPSIDMHPADATARGLEQDDLARIWNEQGDLQALVNISEAVRPGIVSVAGKWWGAEEHGGAVANLLSPSRWSPEGQPAYNEIFVEVDLAAAGQIAAE
ncbi:molybdopterin-containing oxidoreductase family protein [Croceibacterium salegens]|uniref:molybdopterin-containing oxidoreductase family protein n=1 Tax=Croceibacterium salegens TaxID=1737568 RepID=UPI000A7789BD|nr:molybdopterin-dependent oxidoreductase [Croceibacterium salegens]